MSNSTEFKARVRASKWSIEESRWNGRQNSSAIMEFDGTLLGFDWQSPFEKLDIKEIAFFLTVEFTDAQEDSRFLTLPEAAFPAGKSSADYLGQIAMFENGNGGVSTSVGIALPRKLLQEYLLLSSQESLFSTYHDLVTAPNENSIVALVRSATLMGFNPEQ